ncbi:MAG: ATP-binding cassette domain-containing protein [Balneolaceae bacterium]|nr:ATP-binding cassette domain-containing protein [Balneolaceae bacterium]
MNRTIQDAMIAADRLFEIMDLEKEEDGKKIVMNSSLIGDIRFEQIHFRYGSRVTVFEDLSLTIPKGKITAFVGESGSGKTTLVNILQKLYPLQAGRVFIGDLNLKYIENSSLRKTLSVVPQKIDLFAGNVMDNIAVGDINPDLKTIISICRKLGILDFIEELPSGFNTYLGENGTTLSGGQKQRIAIARALYKDPEILILDEATSSLDSSSEQYVRRTVELMKQQGKTIILIAHRLATVQTADHIFLLEKGRVAEEGTHEALIARPGAYRAFWRQQAPALNGPPKF